MAEKKSDKRLYAEATAYTATAAAGAAIGRKGIITKKGEFRALLAEKAPVQKLEQHPHLKRAQKKMAAIPETHKKPGFGTDKYFNERVFLDGGKKSRGTNNLLDRLESKAPKLGYLDAGMPAPKASPLLSQKHATIVIGPPAAGKSTVSNEIARARGAALVDSDVVKSALPEFKKGIGANAVHEESSAIAKKWLERHIAKGDNIVFPRTGDNAKKLEQTIREFKSKGYKVDVVHVAVPPETSMTRMLRRFDRSGRLVNPDFVKSIGDKPAQSLKHVLAQGIVDQHRVVDLSADKPPRAKAAPTGITGQAKAFAADPRKVQAATKMGGRAIAISAALMAASKIAEVVMDRSKTNPMEAKKGGSDQASYDRTYTKGPKAGTTETVRKKS